MNLTKIIASGIIIGGIGIVAVPTIYNKQLNKTISTQIENLAKKDIIIKEKNNKDSFFQTNREYILTIKDITPIAKQINPKLSIYTLNDLKKSFDNTKFLVKLNFSKYPSYHKDGIKISLLNLNNSLNSELSTDDTGKQILKYIKNNFLEISLDIDATKVVKASLKNIDMKLTHKRYDNFVENMKFNINGFNILFTNKTITNLNKISFNFNGKSEKINISLNKFKETINKKSNLNYKENMSIKSFEYSLNKKYSNINLKLNNINSSSHINNVINKLNIHNNFNVKNIIISSKKESISINNIIFNTQINKLDFASVQKIVNSIQQNKVNNNLLKPLQSLVNKGFEFKISPFSIDSANINTNRVKMNINSVKLNFSTLLTKNNYNLKTSQPIDLINNIEAELHIKTTKSNLDLLTKSNMDISNYISMVSKVNKNKVSIDISYKNGKLLANGKPLF